MPQINFIEGQNVLAVECDSGSTLLDASLAFGLPHYHVCGGLGRCSTCRVLVLDGLESFPVRSPLESALATARQWPDTIRLACQSRLTGCATVRRVITDDIDADLAAGETSGWPAAEEREIAILFCDIERFTSIVENQLAYDVIHSLNRFFKQIGDPILANGGIIDKYLGDGLLALFGVQGSSRIECSTRAVRAALRMLAAAQSLGEYLQTQFGFSFQPRIGIHYGSVLVGQIGHPEKIEFTVIGDAVNTASRIEAANKQHGTRLLASEDLVNPIRETLELGKTIEPTQLPGRQKPLQLYEILGFKTVDSTFIVQSTFEQIAPIADSFAQSFYRRLFELRPDLAPLFARTEMTTMRRMLMRMIGLTVRGLPDISDRLLELGARHAGYGVRPNDYASAGESLIYALRLHLGAAFLPDVEQAWLKVFELIRDTMLRGAEARVD